MCDSNSADGCSNSNRADSLQVGEIFVKRNTFVCIYILSDFFWNFSCILQVE